MKTDLLRAVIPGSYDPITLGHVDLIRRTAQIFDDVIVLICINSSKRGLVSPEVRKLLAEDGVSEMKNVRVDCCGGLFADYCNDNSIDVIVKGVRNFADYAYETELKAYNDRIFSDKFKKVPETIFMPSNEKLSYCSSTFVREMLKYNEDVTNYVPNAELLLRYVNR
jgi:pantetheine-phosphate adenylyltransferase